MPSLMTTYLTRHWRRRDWLTHQVHAAVAASVLGTRVSPWRRASTRVAHDHLLVSDERAARVAAQAQRLDPTVVEALAQRAIDAARAAGATYADARLTRIVTHQYRMTSTEQFELDNETLGVGVRALVNGYWGFAASPYWEPEEVVQLARDAVAQAKDNMLGTPRTVDLGTIPTATGSWATPIQIDPFTITIEEKLDFISDVQREAGLAGLVLSSFGLFSRLRFTRQERVIATSDGALFTQTLYETGGTILVQVNNVLQGGPTAMVADIDVIGQGWERLLNAKIPQQFAQIAQDLMSQRRTGQQPKGAEVGLYTLVCDGATMGALVNRTWGVATQLDRALGYEANASGTSILTNPLAMLGQLQVAGPHVTITANRSAPTQLATVQWDDEGVRPEPFPIIRDGVLVDFQTTREQAAWLAPYYQRHQRSVQSHGCAAAESGLSITLQHMPNLALEPGGTAVTMQDLVSSVTKGVLIENGTVETDFQVAGGTVWGTMREITNGRVGRTLTGGAIYFNTLDLWKNITAVGGVSTQVVRSESQYALSNTDLASYKGQPGQATSHSYSGVAATIVNQPLINPARKA